MDNQFLMQPLYLVPKKHVEVKEDTRIDAPASVQELSKNKYLIRINSPLAMDMYVNSILNDKVPYEYFLAGLMYHEVSHIKYNSFDVDIDAELDTNFFRHIANILLDSQIEYHLSIDAPEAAKYIRYVLIALRRTCDTNVLVNLKSGKKVIQMLDTLFYLTRFGVVLPNSDPEFVNFCVPLILSSTRNTAKNVYEAVTAIYEYFFAAVDKSEIGKLEKIFKTIVISKAVLTDEELEKAQAVDAETILASNLQEILEHIKEDQNKRAGATEFEVQLEEKEDAYYRTTVAKHRDNILIVRNAFKRKINEIAERYAYDGELDPVYQQQAYVDSLLGEEGKYYIISELQTRSIDHLLIRDISGSTSSVKDKYAEGCIILHAAIQNLQPSVRDAHIDFSDNAYMLLDFDKKIKEARIHPRAMYGTDIIPAFEMALKLKWRSKSKIINVITDGDVSYGYEDLEQQLIRKGIKIVYWDISPYNRYKRIRQTSLQAFPFDLARMILKEL